MEVALLFAHLARQVMPTSAGIPSIIYLVAAAFCLAFIGLALPAVWSRKAFRRRASLDVLKLILDFLKSILDHLGGGPLA